MTGHTIELVSAESVETVTVEDGQTILEAAEDAGIDVSTSCRAGACTTCAGRLLEGDVDQSRATGLDPGQIDDGYVLLCVSEPTTDCRIRIEVQQELFELP